MIPRFFALLSIISAFTGVALARDPAIQFVALAAMLGTMANWFRQDDEKGEG